MMAWYSSCMIDQLCISRMMMIGNECMNSTRRLALAAECFLYVTIDTQ